MSKKFRAGKEQGMSSKRKQKATSSTRTDGQVAQILKKQRVEKEIGDLPSEPFLDDQPALEDDSKQPFKEPEKALGRPSKFRSKEKILLLTARGIPSRYRHLMLDLLQLLPNSKKDAKLDTKSQRQVINEIADLKGCNNVVFFEARKHKDLYIWMAKSPDGPTVKFLCTNVHTMAELKLSGNHLKGSRPLLTFSKAFDEQPHWQVLKEMLTHIFATPKGHPKSKPFVDHVINFSIADNRLWIRNYQVAPNPDKKKVTPDSLGLIEVGPRVTLNPIKILEGSFGGPVIYSNPEYVSPNLTRADAKRMKAGKYSAKLQNRERRKKHAQTNSLPIDELADVFRE